MEQYARAKPRVHHCAVSYTVKLFCRGGKDFFVLVMDQLMFVKGYDKHWCKYPNSNTVNALRIAL